MPELSLNILDLVENSFSAGASSVEITVEEQLSADTLTITVADDGSGMDSTTLQKAADPFYSGKKGKGWGLGIPFLKQTADLCNGEFKISSVPGSGTTVTVRLQLSHIDRPPLGDLCSTVTTLAAGHVDKDIFLSLRKDVTVYTFDTRIIRRELGDVLLSSPEVLQYIEGDVHQGMEELGLVQ